MTARRASLLNYTPFVAAIDLMTLYLCAWVAMMLGVSAPAYDAAWWHLLPIQIMAALLIFWGSGLYRAWSRRPMADLVILIFAAGTVLGFVWILLIRWEPRCAISYGEIATIVLPQVLGMIAMRGLLRALILRHERAGQVAIVATDAIGAGQIRRKLLFSAPAWLSIDACLTVDELCALADEDIVWHSLVLTPDVEDKTSIVRRASRLGINVMLPPNDFEIFLNGAQLHDIDDLLMVQLRPPSLHLPQRVIKRAFDIAGSIILLTLAAPVMVVVAILIRLSSPGSILFRQTRVGRDGAEFILRKFRTMVADAEKHTGPVLATANDPRITPLGAFLRATRLDEFPQLFNVLRGEMSLVGPRPERPHFVRQFQEELPGYEFRHAVKPGITGLAQVRGGYSTTAQRKLGFDLSYISHYSVLLDIRILLGTASVLFRREQAEGVTVAETAASSEALN